MTYEQVAELFRRFPIASTWPGDNPKVFIFQREGGEERTLDLAQDDGRVRYLRVLFGEVCDHIEPTGHENSQNVYYQLRRAA